MTKKYVNLDAMIPRADFARIVDAAGSNQKIEGISIRDFQPDSLLLPNLRKPDFQRETNHWSPEQIATLIQCFVEGDLIPSVILWQSPAHIFVIDGGHRLSALRAWVEDDYGDGPTSVGFFGININDNQKKMADATRKLVDSKVGRWQHWVAKNKQVDLPNEERAKANNLVSRSIPILWVVGDADKAEASFYKINTQGTALDDIESLLIKNRRRPIPISARSIIRAGTGHKYWSKFDDEKKKEVEEFSKDIYGTLFEPEIKSNIKTLDLPLGGVAGVRDALDLLIKYILLASKDLKGSPEKIDDQSEDFDGSETIVVLRKVLALTERMAGVKPCSLGLHPAIYFYSPTGKHTPLLFMGMATLIARKLANNDDNFFKKFTNVRAKFEEYLLEIKPLLMVIFSRIYSSRRFSALADLYDFIIYELINNKKPSEEDLIKRIGVSGKVIVGQENTKSQKFSNETKASIYLSEAISNALKCPICGGYLDPQKSVTFDHIVRVREGGIGSADNGQMVHPYCNSSVKS
jgi:hypothetical protein